MAVATVNSSGEPRAAPRSAAFPPREVLSGGQHRVCRGQAPLEQPALGVTYFENHLLIVGHGTGTPLRRGSSGFDALRPEREKAFRGGAHALEGIDILIRVDAANLLAFANRPGLHPNA